MDLLREKKSAGVPSAKKIAGFFIVEILIVLVIIGILVTALLPNLTTYTQRAKFIDNLTVAGALKPAVEGCILHNNGTLAPCDSAASGIPASVTAGLGTNVASSAVTNGTITVISAAIFGPASNASYQYVLVPVYQTASGAITWDDSTVTLSTCKSVGLC